MWPPLNGPSQHSAPLTHPPKRLKLQYFLSDGYCILQKVWVRCFQTFIPKRVPNFSPVTLSWEWTMEMAIGKYFHNVDLFCPEQLCWSPCLTRNMDSNIYVYAYGQLIIKSWLFQYWAPSNISWFCLNGFSAQAGLRDLSQFCETGHRCVANHIS